VVPEPLQPLVKKGIVALGGNADEDCKAHLR
jgi:hypothetical protein